MAWEKGGCLILDELPKLDPNTAGLLNEALAETAGQPENTYIKKEEYEKFLKIIKQIRIPENEKVELKKIISYSDM